MNSTSQPRESLNKYDAVMFSGIMCSTTRKLDVVAAYKASVKLISNRQRIHIKGGFFIVKGHAQESQR